MKKLGIVAGFIPWVIFSMLYKNNTPAILEASVCAIFISLIINWYELRNGFIFSWGSIICFSIIGVNGYFNICKWIINNPHVLLNCTIPLIIWISLIVGKPFTLQYAKLQVSPEKWSSPLFIKINNILTIMWGICLSISAIPSLLMSYSTYYQSIWWNTILYYLCLGIAVWLNRKLPDIVKKLYHESSAKNK